MRRRRQIVSIDPATNEREVRAVFTLDGETVTAEWLDPVLRSACFIPYQASPGDWQFLTPEDGRRFWDRLSQGPTANSSTLFLEEVPVDDAAPPSTPRAGCCHARLDLNDGDVNDEIAKRREPRPIPPGMIDVAQDLQPLADEGGFVEYGADGLPVETPAKKPTAPAE